MSVTLSLIFGYAATVAAIIGFQLKKQHHIIISQFFSNSLVALSYIVLDISKIAGGITCLVGAAQTLINFFYLKKDKTPPKGLTLVFLAAYIGASVFALSVADAIRFPYDLLPLLGSFAFLIGVSTKNSTATRYWFLANIIIWIVYDAAAAPVAVANLVTHTCILISVIVGIVRYDILKK